MFFLSKWITTHEFAPLQTINVFHKEHDRVPVPESPIRNNHVYFRKKLSIKKNGQVTMDISADDYYKLYINGVFIAQGPASSYADTYQYNHLDITPFIHEGENIFAVHVYYHGEITRAYDSGDNRQGFIADIYVDGNYYCGTDETWVYHTAEEYSGALTGPHKTQFLENIDFRKKDAAWKELNFHDGHYTPAVVSENDDHIFQDIPAVNVDVYRLSPQKIIPIEKGKWLLDFGTEITGQFYMKVKGVPGQIVQILYGEELSDENPYQVRYEMRCDCTYKEICTLSGQEDEFDFYDYKAFRFVNIFTDHDNITSDTFCAIVRHHPFHEKCCLKSTIKWVEDIWKLCTNTLKYGVQEGFLDCPTREKGQYLGDFTVSGLAHLYVTGDSQMYRKTLFDFAGTTRVCKGLLSVAPGSLMQEIADFSLQYPMQVFHYYQYTKDRETLWELYPIVRGVVEYFSKYARDDGLLVHVNDKWNLVDWPDNLRDGYEIPEEDGHSTDGCHNVLNAHYIGAVSYLQKIEEVLNMEPDRRLEKLTASFLKTFYDERKKIFYDSPQSSHSALHSNVLPVFYGIAPKESWNTIKEMIRKKGLLCGTQFSYFVLKALGKMGAYQEEFELLTNESSHSWVNMIREGGTTCFEAWGKDQKWNTSLCHPWSCAPIIILLEDILRIAPSILNHSGEKICLNLNDI